MPSRYSVAFALAILPFASAADEITSTRLRCNADNCLRQVRASAFPTRTRDCSSFISRTIVPTVTFTVTTTTTLYSSVPDDGPTLPGPMSPSVPALKPAYASYCKNDAAYVSACNCIGVSGSPVTAPPSTTTSTTTASISHLSTLSLGVGYGPDSPSDAVQYVGYMKDEKVFLKVESDFNAKNQDFVRNQVTGELYPKGQPDYRLFYQVGDGASPFFIAPLSSESNHFQPFVCQLDFRNYFACYDQGDGPVNGFAMCDGGDFDGLLLFTGEGSSTGYCQNVQGIILAAGDDG